ncbi:MAG: galactokinase family protein [Acidimicrobiales bacterium]|nr:galactokinase family protein [Acidimicrobiales bacterium]
MIVTSPGRVNIIGDHTDYVGGLAMPCAIDLAVTASFEPASDIDLTSDATAEHAAFSLPLPDDAGATTWTRLVHAVASRVPDVRGAQGRLTTTLPIGAGLSSSAACTIALALTLGFDGDRRALVLLAQAAEQAATGVPCGVLDQLAIVYGEAGHACVVDAAAVTASPISFPEDARLLVVPSGHHRTLSDTPYAQRRTEAERAMAEVGGLEQATVADALSVADPVLRRRARHVVTENARVTACAEAFAAGDLRRAGALMLESHTSLNKDAEVSTKDLNQLVDALSTRKGVFGARLTGAGFGGSVIALVEPGAGVALAATFGGRLVTPSNGARLV